MEKYEIKRTENRLPEKFNRNEILQHLEFARESYLNFFVGKGFSKHDSVNMIAKEVDPSVLFIGSTISALKPMYLNNEIPHNGVVIAQPCIRTQNMKNLYTETSNKGNTFFNLLGGLTEGENFKHVCNLSIKYFNEQLKIPHDRIFARVSSSDKDILEDLKSIENCPELEIDGRKPGYYRWKYGIEGVSGRGIALAIRNAEKKNSSMTLGNVILMDSSEYSTAVQWGYGIESIISGFYNKGSIIEGSLIAQVVPYEKSMLPKFADALVAVIEMYELGLKPDNRGEASFLRGYLKGLAFWAKKLKISESSLKEYVFKYCKLRGVIDSDKIYNEITKELNIHYRNIRNLQAHLRTAKLSANQNNGDFTALIKRLSNKYRIHPEEVQSILKTFLENK